MTMLNFTGVRCIRVTVVDHSVTLGVISLKPMVTKLKGTIIKLAKVVVEKLIQPTRIDDTRGLALPVMAISQKVDTKAHFNPI